MVADSKDPPSGCPGLAYYYLRPGLAEFFGTLLLAFMHGSALIAFERAKDKPFIADYALAIGLCVAYLMNGFGWISGGHFNPAVTIGVVLGGGIRWPFAIIYTFAQCLGGFVGSACAVGVLRGPAKAGKDGTADPDGTAGKPDPVAVFFIEMMLTLFVIVIVLTSTDESNVSPLATLIVGFAFAAGAMAHGATSGAFMNPALGFGSALSGSLFDTGKEGWKSVHLYVLAPIVGALIGAVLYRLFFANYKARWIIKDESVG